MKSPYRKIAIAALSGAAFTPDLSLAQTSNVATGSPEQRAAAADTGAVADIVVTANRRSESLSKVPVSVAAVTSDQLQSRGIVNASDLSGSLPNVRVNSPFGNTQPNFTVRGIGLANEFNANAQSPVGVYFDDIYQGFRASQGAALFDLERVEVLKGPQGTLYGRNTTGGAINLITRKPDLSSANGYLTAGYGNYNAYLVQGALEGTLVEDKLGVRVAFMRSRHDGFIKNAGPENGYPGIAGNHDFQEDDGWAARLTVRAKPVENIDVVVRGYIARNNPVGTGGVPYLIGPNQTDPVGYSRANLGRREAIQPDTGRFYTLTKGVSGKIDWQLGDFIITNTTGYDTGRLTTRLDFDGSPTSIGTYRINDSKFWGFNQDLHVTYDSDRVNVIAGAYFGQQQVSNFSDLYYFGFLDGLAGPNQFNPLGLFFTGPGAPPPTSVGTTLSYRQKQTSYAGYLEAKIKLLDDVHLTLGGRVTRDRIEFREFYSLLRDSSGNNVIYAYTSRAGVAGNFPIIGGAALPEFDSKITKPTGRAILDYQISPATMVYISASRGYRSGSFNGQSLVVAPDEIKPEFVNAFEAGIKTRFLDGRVQLNAAVFYNKYIGQQVQEVVGGAAFLRSLDGRMLGGEVEITAQPTDRLRIVAAASYLNTRYASNQFLAPGDPRAPDARGFDIGGNQFPFAPKFTALFAPEYTILDTGSGKLVGSGEVQYASRQYFDFFNDKQAVGPLAKGQKAYALVNGRIQYSTDRYHVAIWSRNIFNKYYIAYGINLELFGDDYFVPGAPRTFGIEAGIKF